MASYNDDLNDILNDDVFKKMRPDSPVQRIKVIGVGGGGNNAVIHMHRRGIKDVSFVLLNTDKQVLDSADVPTKVLIGPGRGAGGKPERARKFAEENAEEIARLFDDDTDMVFITAGMGGGTGTGAAPVVARIAKERGILTVGIVTVPFRFEGELKVAKALAGAEAMAKNVDSLLVINNERLYDIFHDMDIFNAFAHADDTLLDAAQSISDIITYQGLINRDFNDVDTTLRDGGSAIISTGYGEGPDRVTKAIQDALHSPLLKDTDIFNAKKLLMILYVSDDKQNHPFNMSELQTLNAFERSLVNKVDVIWGLYPQSDLGDKVRITILASGFDAASAQKTDVKKQNQPRVDKPVEVDSYGKNYGYNPEFVSMGKVLDPSSYDNPDDDNLKQLEQEPAIARSPYKRFMTGLNGSQYGSSSDLGINDKDQAPDDHPRKKGLLLTFDDV